jgi:SpoVK/Ycf46/Vps4 family AAA+-type ATPase
LHPFVEFLRFKLVTRPNLSAILRSKSLGEAEEIFLSLCDIRNSRSDVLVILEDIHDLIGISTSSSDENSTENHLLLRCLASLRSVFDSLRVREDIGGNTLVLCTSRHYVASWSLQFDRIYYLGPPDGNSRKKLISSFFLTEDQTNDAMKRHFALETLLSQLVGLTEGFSYASLSSSARRSVENVMQQAQLPSSPDFDYMSMIEMKEILKLGSPESLRPTSSDHFADVRISTSKDLLSLRDGMKIDDPYNFDMKGESACRAWNELQRAIVIPLCHSKSLLELIGGNFKSLTGGVLLVGMPGCGKSEIALQCGIYCSFILSSLKLFRVSCTSLIHKEVGGSEKSIQMLFETVRQASPCLLVLDGIENIASPRGADSTSEGTMDRVLSTLLVELDGIDEGFGIDKPNIAVIGITQHSQWVDAALLRPGRLGTIIKLEKDWMI